MVTVGFKAPVIVYCNHDKVDPHPDINFPLIAKDKAFIVTPR